MCRMSRWRGLHLLTLDLQSLWTSRASTVPYLKHI